MILDTQTPASCSVSDVVAEGMKKEMPISSHAPRKGSLRLSVIVPIYNVERFLSRCLNSLLRQGLQEGDYEIICVNDGSTDGSAAILADYQQRHPDLVRVITQENQGLGAARNTGTAVAKGEYVGYVDSDDYLIDGGYGYICQHFLDKKPDVVTFGFRCVYTDGQQQEDSSATPEGKVIFEGYGADLYNRDPLPFVWSKLYRREFLETHGIRSEVVVCQDELFNFEVFRHQPYTIQTSCNICRYEQLNGNSIQKTLNDQRLRKHLKQLLYNNIPRMEDYLESGQTVLEAAAWRNINNFLNTFYRKVLRTCLSWKEWRRYKRRLRDLPTYYYPFRINRMAKLVTAVKQLSMKSYGAYLLTYFFDRHIFKQYIFPWMVVKRQQA